MQFLPSDRLLPFIKHYLFLQNNSSAAQTVRLFSDGRMALVFSFGTRLQQFTRDPLLAVTLPPAFLYGQLTSCKDVRLSETSLVIVVFQPAGFQQLFAIPAGALVNQIISAGSIFNNAANDLQDALAETISLQGKCDLLNIFFTALTSKRMLQSDAVITASLFLIRQQNGCVPVSQLVKLTGYTERHIERKFITSVGISPRHYSNIVQLHHALKQLQQNSKKDILTAVAYDAGYFDQSHFIRHFKKITGITPNVYAGKLHKLATNFVQLPSA